MTTINDLKKVFGWNAEQSGPIPIGEPGAVAPPKPDTKKPE
jgi:hypothetical protein